MTDRLAADRIEQDGWEIATRLADRCREQRAVIRRLLTQRNEIEFVLGDGWALRNELWSYVPESDAEADLLVKIMEDSLPPALPGEKF